MFILGKTAEKLFADVLSSSIKPILFPSDHLNPIIVLIAIVGLGALFYVEKKRRSEGPLAPEIPTSTIHYGFFDQLVAMARHPVRFIQREMQDPPGFFGRNVRFAAVCLVFAIILSRWDAPVTGFELSGLLSDSLYGLASIILPAGVAALLWLLVRGTASRRLIFWNFVAFSAMATLAWCACQFMALTVMDVLSPSLQVEAGSSPIASAIAAVGGLLDCANDHGLWRCVSVPVSQLGLEGEQAQLVDLLRQPGFQVATGILVLCWLISTAWILCAWRGWKVANRVGWLRTIPVLLTVWVVNSLILRATLQTGQQDTIGISSSGSITASPNPCAVTSAHTQCISGISWTTSGLGSKKAVVYYQIDESTHIIFDYEPSCTECLAPFIQPEHSYTFSLYVFDQTTGHIGPELSRVVVTATRNEGKAPNRFLH